MDRCHLCGASNTAGAQWCSQCYARLSEAQDAVTVPHGSLVSAGSQFGLAPTTTTTPATGTATATPQPFGWQPPGGAAQPLPTPRRTTRWRKTTTTFGPLGRVLATIGLVIPFLIMLIGGFVADPFALGGAAIWGVIIMPWGLKDVWRAGQLPAR